MLSEWHSKSMEMTVTRWIQQKDLKDGYSSRGQTMGSMEFYGDCMVKITGKEK